MGYPRGIDDYTTEELLLEIDQRIVRELEDETKCTYCHTPTETHKCKYAKNPGDYHALSTVLNWVQETNNAIEGIRS